MTDVMGCAGGEKGAQCRPVHDPRDGDVVGSVDAVIRRRHRWFWMLPRTKLTLSISFK